MCLWPQVAWCIESSKKYVATQYIDRRKRERESDEVMAGDQLDTDAGSEVKLKSCWSLDGSIGSLTEVGDLSVVVHQVLSLLRKEGRRKVDTGGRTVGDTEEWPSCCRC